MSYKVRYEDRKDYLFVHIAGPESYDNAIQLFQDLRKKTDTEHYKAFLIVDEVTGALSAGETYRLSTEIAKIHRGNIIAFVDPKEHTYNANAYGGTVVANRGVITEVFTNEKDAMEWLHLNVER
jgi:hypothetical protein